LKKKLTIIAVAILAAALGTLAQSNTISNRFEVAGGYDFTRANVNSGGSNLNGGFGSLQYNFIADPNVVVGLTLELADVGGSISGVGTNAFSYMLGPTVSYRGFSKIQPFAHGLFGETRTSLSFEGQNVSQNKFSYALGGGIDVPIGTGKFVFRPVQIDYLRTAFGSQQQNNFRYEAGIVIRF